MNIDELITFEPYKSCYEYGYEQGSCDQYSLAVNKARADERAKVIEEFTKKLYEQENNINDANYGFNFVQKVISEMKHHKVR